MNYEPQHAATTEHTAAAFMNRRSFMRSMLGIGVGVTLGATLPASMHSLNEQTSAMSGHPAGNAGLRKKVELECATTQPNDIESCIENWEPSVSDQIRADVIAPISEEISFRALPSVIVDSMDNKLENNPYDVIIGGTEKFAFTRRELYGGLISSVLFGAVHNVTKTGIDTQTIPASQTVSGLMLWYMMRRFGVASSIAMHSSFNFFASRLR